MKNSTVFLILAVIICPLVVSGQENDYLETGWYGISSSQNAYLRIDAKMNDSFFIDPKPIVTTKDFKSLTIRDSPSGYMSELVFKLEDSASDKWEVATTRYVGLKIGFVLNNKLIQVLTVNEPIYELDSFFAHS